MAEKILTGNETFLLWGAGRWGGYLLRLFPELPVKAFIDSNVEKQGQSVKLNREVPILSYEEARKAYPDAIIVITMLRVNVLRRLLLSLGYTERKDFFSIQDFVARYALDCLNKYYLYSVVWMQNNTCSLQCEGCLTYAPLAKEKVIRPLEELKREADLLFKTIDKAMLVCFSSAEPFLHPQFVDFIEYCCQNYSDKCQTWNIVTNSTIVPDDEDLQRISKLEKVLFSLSDYSDRVSYQAKTQKRLIEKLEEYGIQYFLNVSSNEDYWDSPGDPRQINETSEKLLHDKYCACSKSPYGIYQGNLFYCMQASLANMNFDIPIYEEDYYDLETENDKEKLVNIILRTPPNGYTEFCKHCNGRVG